VAESTLTLTRDDLRKAVGNLLGLGIDITSWDSEFATRVDMAVDIGCRWVYEPELIPGDAEVHIWSFMQPKLLAFTLNQPYATGTCTVSSGVVTGDGTVFPSWAADGEFVVGDISYAVASRDSDTQLTLEDTTVDAVAGSSYTLQQVDYTLPDLFGGFQGDLYLNQTNTSLGYILERSSKEELLQFQKSGIADFASQPARYAVFAKDQTGAADQKWQITVWPFPDAVYTITGFYVWNPYQLTSALPYPMGGLPLSECLREAVLAAAEVEFKGEAGIHNQLFRAKLQAAVSYDRRVSNPGLLGQNLDNSSNRAKWSRLGPRVMHVGLGDITYNERVS
jgi:hypothetical protein